MSTAVPAAAETTREPNRLANWLLAPSVVDWFLAGYASTVVGGLLLAEPGPTRARYLSFATTVLLAHLCGVYVYRMRAEGAGGAHYLTRTAYRLFPVVVMVSFYLNLRPILPLLNPSSYDELLRRLDVLIFGFEPTLAVEPYLTRGVVEWFSFFYQSYFYLVGAFVFVLIFCEANERRLAHFAAGIIIVLTVGHFLYAIVPGLGPYALLSHEYAGPLDGGAFYEMMLETVSAGGAMKDIFPSLHTALPMYCCLFCWQHYRKLAIVPTFFAVNIMIATVVLRWHWAVDVLAGLTLAVTSFVVGPRLMELYQRTRNRYGLGWRARW